MKVLSISELIVLNKYVQGIVSKDVVNDWFLSFGEEDRQSIVKSVWELAIQARISESDIELAAEAANLKLTHTPVVMLLHGKTPFRNRGYKISAQRGTILVQGFSIVLECFSLAEQRRKNRENPKDCHHWWHGDLSNELFVASIKEGNGSPQET
jgi:hypothetical protein